MSDRACPACGQHRDRLLHAARLIESREARGLAARQRDWDEFHRARRFIAECTHELRGRAAELEQGGAA